MTRKRIGFTRKVSAIKMIFGILLFSGGIVLGITGDYRGLIISVMSLLFIRRDGIDLDLEIRKYRTFTDVLGIKFGAWKDIPEIEYISVFKTTESSVVRSRSAETTVKNEIITLNLFYDGNQHVKAYRTTDINDAFEVAEEIASVLKTDILDATGAEQKWL